MSARRGALFEAALAACACSLFFLAAALGRPSNGSYAPTPREPDTLRVVTWNIGGASSGKAHAARNEDTGHVAGILRELEPDLVLLQETASKAQVERLLADLGSSWTAASPIGRGVVALARDAELRSLGEGRGAQRWKIVRWRRGGRTLTAAAVHAHAYSSRRRNREIGAALGALIDQANSPMILAGDLNLDLDLDKRRDLFSDDEYLDVESYNYVAQRLSDAASGRGSTAEPDRRLDYIFFDPATLRASSAGPWKGRRIGDMDHDPVIADFRWR